MNSNQIRVLQWMLLASLPLSVYGFSAGPPVGRNAVPADGGVVCTACHRTFALNSGVGKLSINAFSYTPGVKQTITVTLDDPDARRWGFQLTARPKSDESKMAGTFTVSDETRVKCFPDDRDAPCNGDREFATHTQPATRPGTTGPRVFTVEWTPPAEDVGEIILYAAGNAANGDFTPNGDHIYTTNLTIRPECNLTQRPSVGGATDAASFRPVISSNALISIFGGPFASPANKYRAVGSDLVAGKVPTQFACVAVEISGKRAPVYYVQRDQINAQAPIINVSGPVDVRVILNPGTPREIRGEDVKVQVGTYTPALFNGTTGSLKPGEIVTLYGTGFGFTEPVYQPGEFIGAPARLRDPFTVTMGGVALSQADILYAGLSPDAPGLYQFNLRIPSNLPDGNAPVSIRMGGAETQSGFAIAVKR